jgi:hypothetical protein
MSDSKYREENAQDESTLSPHFKNQVRSQRQEDNRKRTLGPNLSLPSL